MTDSGLTFIENGGVRLCLERRGHGARHVLFVHGWISSRRMWYDVVDRLDPAAITAHLVDFRGCGLSDRPEGHDFEAYASDLRAALRAAGAPLTLVGHSMGGRLAQYVATEAPAQVERLILVAPGSAKPVRSTVQRRELALAAFGSRGRIERFVRAAMAKEVPESAMLRLVDDALLCQRKHWTHVFTELRADFTPRLASIAIPVLAIAGEKDPLAPPQRVKRDVALPIPGSRFVVLRGCGHNLPVEAPGEVAAAVERFQ